MASSGDNILNTPGNNWGKLTAKDMKKISTPQGFYEWMLINAADILAATQAEVDAGVIDNKYVSPLTLANSPCCTGGGGTFHIDGGTWDSIYIASQLVDGGGF